MNGQEDYNASDINEAMQLYYDFQSKFIESAKLSKHIFKPDWYIMPDYIKDIWIHIATQARLRRNSKP